MTIILLIRRTNLGRVCILATPLTPVKTWTLVVLVLLSVRCRVRTLVPLCIKGSTILAILYRPVTPRPRRLLLARAGEGIVRFGVVTSPWSRRALLCIMAYIRVLGNVRAIRIRSPLLLSRSRRLGVVVRIRVVG